MKAPLPYWGCIKSARRHLQNKVAFRFILLCIRCAFDRAWIENGHAQRAAAQIMDQDLVPVNMPGEHCCKISRNVCRIHDIMFVPEHMAPRSHRGPIEALVNA